MKVVPSLGSVLPAPAARSTPATVADPDHLQLTPAVPDPVLLGDAAVIPGPEDPPPRIHAQTAGRRGPRGRQAVARVKVVPLQTRDSFSERKCKYDENRKTKARY